MPVNLLSLENHQSGRRARAGDESGLEARPHAAGRERTGGGMANYGPVPARGEGRDAFRSFVVTGMMFAEEFLHFGGVLAVRGVTPVQRGLVVLVTRVRIGAFFE
jgi:hypothetical protein